MSIRIFNNSSKTVSFETEDNNDVNSITVGKIISEGAAELNLKVGDKIYLTLDVDITGFSGELPDDDDDLPDFFQSFFSLWTETDDDELSVELLEVQVPDSGTAGTLDDHGNATGLYTLRYLLDTSDLDSGEKIINVWVIKEDIQDIVIEAARTTTASPDDDIFVTSQAFYLHQSLTEKFQEGTSIANDRNTINFPSYLPVGLQPVNPRETDDVKLWKSIKATTDALQFKKYKNYMDVIFCGEDIPMDLGNEFQAELKRLKKRRRLPFTDTDSYRSVKIATEAFVMATLANSTGDLTNYLETVSDSKGNTLQIIPYLAIIRNKLSDIDFKSTSFEDALSNFIDADKGRVADTCYGIIAERIQTPCFLELIWSYWHEECMMVQGVNAISRRFQNIRGEGATDPLANIEIGPLRPLSNLMWGYVQDEQHRLTVRRRGYEYDHHYGISMQGNALKGMRTADSRSKFIEAFHTLLNLCVRFYKQNDDTTVVADGFPVMNALKEVHMILSEGAHNQYGDLPSTARIEMLMQQYLLARPEFREFLPTRQMVPYPEAWMDRTAVINSMHNWTKTSVLHFRDLGVFGEQILLSIRFGAWSTVFDRDQAANWAIYWRPQIQNYIHAYRAATGADLSREDAVIDAQQPSVHLLRRLNEQNSKMRV